MKPFILTSYMLTKTEPLLFRAWLLAQDVTILYFGESVSLSLLSQTIFSHSSEVGNRTRDKLFQLDRLSITKRGQASCMHVVLTRYVTLLTLSISFINRSLSLPGVAREEIEQELQQFNHSAGTYDHVNKVYMHICTLKLDLLYVWGESK